MSFTTEEQQLMQRLRDKYSGHADVQNTHDQQAEASSAPYTGSDQTSSSTAGASSSTYISVTLCSICQGSGVQTEIYNHRQLQRSCSACNGEGLINPPAASRPARQGVNSSADRSSAKAVHGRGAINAQLERYQKEREELLAAQAGCDDAQLGALRADLVKQLDGHIAALQQRKQAAGA